MTNVNHQVNWHLLVTSGRAKAHGVNWTDAELKQIRSGKKTVADLRKKYEVEKAKAVLKANGSKKIADKKAEEKAEKVVEGKAVEEKAEEKAVK